MKKLIKICMIFAMTISMTSCYDKRDINYKLFVTTLAFDVGQDVKKAEKMDIKGNDIQTEDIKRLKITCSFPNIPAGSDKSGVIAQNNDIEVQGYNVGECWRSLLTQTSRQLSFDQTRVLIFTENLLKNPGVFKECMDFLLRVPTIATSSLVVVVENDANNFLGYSPKMENNIQAYLSELLKNGDGIDTIFPMSLERLNYALSDNGNASLPRMSIDKITQDVYVNGIVTLKEYEFDAVLGRNDVVSIELINGYVKYGMLVGTYKGDPITVRVDRCKSNIEFIGDENQLKFLVKLNLEGALIAKASSDSKLTFKCLREIEKELSEGLRNDCECTVIAVQKKTNVDPFSLMDVIKKHHPKVWKKIKDNAIEKYKDAIVIFDINTEIQFIGEIL